MSHRIHDYPRPRSALPPALLPLALILVAVPLIGCMSWLAWQFAQLNEVVAGVLRVLVFAAPIGLGTVGAGLAGLIAWRRWGYLPSVAANNEALIVRARTQIAPLASSFSYHQQLDQLAMEDEPLALPAPLDVGPLPLESWLRWNDAQPHTIYGGATKRGKTTTARALLALRLARGETVFIVDPHSSDWCGLPVAGGNSAEWDLLLQPGRKRDDDGPEAWELARALLAAFGEYQRRMQIREEHKKRTGRELPPHQFQPLTILIDEANTIAELFPALWSVFLKLVASGTRKVDISFVLLAHSPLVEDLKISATMRSNFASIALDERSCQLLIDQCRDKARQTALNALLPDLDWPALASIDGRLMFLDRTGMDQLPEPLDASSQAWDGWDYAAGRARVPLSPVEQQPPADEPRGTQTLVPAAATLPTEIGGVALGYLIAKMVARRQPASKIGDVLAGLVVRVQPASDRRAVAEEIARRAALFVALGNAAAIAAGLDRDQLLRMCLECGAGVSMAIAIWGGNSNKWYADARSIEQAS